MTNDYLTHKEHERACAGCDEIMKRSAVGVYKRNLRKQVVELRDKELAEYKRRSSMQNCDILLYRTRKIKRGSYEALDKVLAMIDDKKASDISILDGETVAEMSDAHDQHPNS